MYESSAHTIDQIAVAHGVSLSTVYRSLKRTASRNLVMRQTLQP